MFNIPEKGSWSTLESMQWQDGDFVGNGEIGGILYGNSQAFSLIASHHALFLKSSAMDEIPDLSGDLKQLRQIIADEGYQKGIAYFEEKAIDKGYQGLTMSDLFHPAAELQFVFESNNVSDCNFKRALDYEKGLVTHVSSHETFYINKRFFASKEERALYFEVYSDQPQNFTVHFKCFNQEALKQTFRKVDAHTLIQKGEYYDGSSYSVPFKWLCEEGEVTVYEDKVVFQQVKKVQFALSVHIKEEDLVLDDFDAHLASHVSSHRSRYNKVALSLTSKKERERSFESICAEMEESGRVPLVLYEKLYDASRYFIQAMSGKALPNLQGVWSGDFSPPWSGDYTLDTNVQLAIASLASLGLFEGFEGFFSQMAAYDGDFKENAKKYFNARGYLVPVHASTRALHVHWNKDWPLVFWTAGAGWLAHFYHEYYTYTLDETFLEYTALPFYEEVILFYSDFLVEEDGKGLLRPSYSAENGMGDNATMDVAVIRATIDFIREGSAVLNLPFSEEFDQLLRKLPDYLIDSEGVLKEWIDEKKEENHNHRHFSNLYPVFQSKEITAKDPELWQAAHKAFDKRLEAWLLSDEGDTSSSHGRIHAAMCAIALERPDDVEAALKELLLNRAFYPSLATSHYNESNVFNLDANGSYPKVIHDALIYPERNGSVTLLKAVPSWLKEGELRGIHLPNGIQVQSFKWNKEVCELAIVSREKQRLRIQLADEKEDHFLYLKENKVTELTLPLVGLGDESREEITE